MQSVTLAALLIYSHVLAEGMAMVNALYYIIG